jgi:hypothetical protein
MTSYSEGRWTQGRELVSRLAWRIDPGLVLALFLPVFVAIPLLRPGLPRTADGYLHLLRVVEVDQCWRDGVLYPRWAPDMAFGYGYPIFNYFAPLLYQLTELVHVAGLGFESAFKLVLVGCLVLGVWGTYALTKDLLSSKAGILAAAAYCYSPFVLREIYVRGGYAQLLAVSLIPAVLWSFHRLMSRGSPVYVLTSTFLLVALLIGHNITALFFLPFLVLFVIWIIYTLRGWGKVRQVILVLVLSLALASIFLLPALAEKPLVKLDRSREGYLDFRQHFLTVGEILSPSAVPDSSSLNPIWLHNLGTAHLPLLALGLLALAVGPLTGRQRMLAAFFVVMLVICIFMTLPPSTPIWDHVPLLAFAQFPWRVLDLSVPASALLVGMSADLWSRLPGRRTSTILVTVSVLFTVVAAFVHLYVQWPHESKEQLSPADVVVNELRTGIVGTTSTGECLPVWVLEEPASSPLVGQYLASTPISKLDTDSLPSSAQAELIEHTVVSDRYRVQTPESFTVRFNTFYFPGWQALVDGGPVPISPSYPEGLMTFEVPAGEHDVLVRFTDTPVRTVANLVCGGALLLMAGVTLFVGVRWRRRDSDQEHWRVTDRLSWPQAGILGLLLVALLLFKMLFVDPHTTWFRKSSPPGHVLGVQHAAQINVNDEVLFMGYDVSSDSVAAGDELRVTLYLQAQGRLREDYSVFVHLDDLRPNYISWSLSEEQSPADMPTSGWTPGFYVSDSHVLTVSPETPPGMYVLRAGLYRPDTGERLPVLDGEGNAASDSIDLARIRVRRTEPVSLAGTSRLGPLTLGGRIRLVGYKLADGEAKPGNYFRLFLYWEALEEMPEDYVVFVHLVDDSGETWAQGDSVPVGGIYPTWAWVAGETVEDEHLIPLETDVPAGTYHLSIGMYELSTLSRLEVRDAEGASLGDSVLLPAALEVESP